MLKTFTGFMILILLASGCSLFRPAISEEQPVFIYPDPDSEMIQMLEAYRPAVERFMGQRIATVQDTIRFDQPEGALGNLVADALRYRAAHETHSFVHIGVIGESSFNLYFEPGDLTLGHIYEFMPYENHLVVLTLTGEKVQELMNQVAALGGAPVSGVRFNINEENTARGILVNSEVIDPERNYLVATTSWAANGGDVFPALWDAANRIDLNVSVRQIILEYFSRQAVLVDFRDGRIR
jgi:2',3'-cyclic-nucleotide 2'-phosphodiesterase (5'-nucleotidase family)